MLAELSLRTVSLFAVRQPMIAKRQNGRRAQVTPLDLHILHESTVVAERLDTPLT